MGDGGAQDHCAQQIGTVGRYPAEGEVGGPADDVADDGEGGEDGAHADAVVHEEPAEHGPKGAEEGRES